MILRFERVGFGYRRGTPVLTDVSFAVDAGESVGLFGPNGAGKTTVTRLAMGLIRPTAGQVHVLDTTTTLTGPDRLADRVGYLFQHPESQLFARSVHAEIAFGLEQLGWPPDAIAMRTTEVLDELGLTSAERTHPYDLPAPIRRLVALGTAIAARPRLLLLDEPTAGLDRQSRATVQQVMTTFASGGGSVLAVTHDGEFAAECLGRALVLQDHRLVADQPTSATLLQADRFGVARVPVVQVVHGLSLTPADLRRATVARSLVDLRQNPGSEHGTC